MVLNIDVNILKNLRLPYLSLFHLEQIQGGLNIVSQGKIDQLLIIVDKSQPITQEFELAKLIIDQIQNISFDESQSINLNKLLESRDNLTNDETYEIYRMYFDYKLNPGKALDIFEEISGKPSVRGGGSERGTYDSK